MPGPISSSPNPSRRARGTPVAALLAAVALALAACGGNVESRLQEVRALHDAGDFSGTIETLRDVLASQPNHAEANYLLGISLVQTRQPSLAVWPLRKAAADEEFAVSAGLMLASTLAKMGSVDEAVRAADGVLAVEPDNVMALQVRANAHVEGGHPDEALGDAEHLLELQPESHAAHALKAMALSKLGREGDAEAALVELDRIAREQDDPNAAMRSCASLAVHYRERESEKAGPAFERCLEEHPTQQLVLKEAESYFDTVGEPERATEAWERAVEADPDSFALRSRLAARLESRERFEEAERVLREGVELFGDAAAWDHLSRFLQNRGRLEEAQEAIARAIELGGEGDTEPLRFREADLLVSAGQLDEAEALAATFEQEVFRDLIRGRILLARGQKAAALDALEAALSRWPNNPAARYLAGTAAEQLGDRTKALAHYREAVRADAAATDAALSAAVLQLANGEFADALALARGHLTQRETSGAEARQVAGRAATALGEYDQARVFFVDLSTMPGHEITGVLELAHLERQARGSEAAAAMIERSPIDLTDPEAAPVLRTHADDLVRLGRGEDALVRAEAAAAAHPEEPAFHDIRGRVHVALGRDEAAAAAFDEALAIDPEYAPALTAKAHLELAAGRPDEAVALLDRATASDPDDADAAHLAAQIRLEQGQRGEAESRLRDVVRARPDHAGAANDLAWLLAEEGKELDLALELAARAARLQPRPEILDTLGWVQLKRGQAAAAAESFERALDANPDAPSVRYRLALAQEALGRPAEALDTLREAVSGGSFPEVQQARAEIARLEAGGVRP